MREKIKNIMVIGSFLVCIIGSLIMNIITEDKSVSEAERRKLNTFPKITMNTLKSGSLSEKLEDYAMDQFFLRDELRGIKANVAYNIFKETDNNGLYVFDNSIIVKKEYPLNEGSLNNFASKLNSVYERYLDESNKVYYTIVPDKNYFFEGNDKYLVMDYNKLKSTVNKKVNSKIKYIDIFNELTLSDYYNTDTHWKQEKLGKVANKIANYMGFEDRINSPYKYVKIGDFKGVYYGQLALKNILLDTITYMTNDVIKEAKVYNYETNEKSEVYDLSKLGSLDLYDIYLSGACALLEITNNKASTDDELIIFRDSFGSSISPLFIQAYKKITLIDIRYISSSLLDEYVDFKNKDVLFLYSTLIINSSYSLK